MRGLDFAKQKTGGEKTTPQSKIKKIFDSSPDKGSLFFFRDDQIVCF